MKKTMQAMAVAVLVMALAAPVWGHSDAEYAAAIGDHRGYPILTMHPDANPFSPNEPRIEVTLLDAHLTPRQNHARVRILGLPGNCNHPGYSGRFVLPSCFLYWRTRRNYIKGNWTNMQLYPPDRRSNHGDDVVWNESDRSFDLPWSFERHDWDFVLGFMRMRQGPPRTVYDSDLDRDFTQTLYMDAIRHIHYRTPSAPEPEPPSPPPEPEPPAPEPPEPPPEPEPPSPPEPEPPEPETPSPPEPEVPDPEEPDHTHPVERCDHIAIVPAMPRALSGDEGSPDHWLRISNLGAASITFAITGLDEGGTKAGTYRRELPASRIVRVKMRDVEAAFDVEPEGWWRLVVTGSGPLEVVATMRQGAERRFVPVRTPATCTSGPVTRTGG